jgi:O-succinylhomoserine sulfhydrylase
VLNDLMPRYGALVELVDGANIAAWERALAKPVSLVFIETPSNPTLELIDIKAVAKLTHKAGGLLIVDNVFATPLLQKPMALGADIVVYSATKHIDGQGRTLGGAILCSKQFMADHLGPYLRHTGPALSPFNAWVLLKGLETLDLRVRRQTETAAALADRLAAHPKVAALRYPGRADHPQADIAKRQMSAGSTLIALDLGTRECAFNFLNALQIVDISNNLGDSKSMATHPTTTTHRSMTEEQRLEIGLTPGWVRLSVGLEGTADLARDLERALDAA